MTDMNKFAYGVRNCLFGIALAACSAGTYVIGDVDMAAAVTPSKLEMVAESSAARKNLIYSGLVYVEAISALGFTITGTRQISSSRRKEEAQ